MVRVKICGITNPEDAVAAASAGADAIGLNLVGGPRRIPIDAVEPIVAALPASCTPVALVDLDANPIDDDIWKEALTDLQVRVIQCYGEASDRVVPALQQAGFLPVLVHRVNADSFPTDFQSRLDSLGTAAPQAVVFDAYHPSQLGGTGHTFDWQLLREYAESANAPYPRIILAGGLNPTNIAEAVRITQPYAVDVSSGVENAPGAKCPQRMRDFVLSAKGQTPLPPKQRPPTNFL